MNISKYTAYFHDGGLIDIEHIGDKICLSMISAQVDKDDIVDESFFSKDHRLKGHLVLKGVSEVWIDDKPFNKILKREYDSGNIFDFQLENHQVILVLSWSNYPPKKSYETDLICYKFNADQIIWEPQRDLVDPFW